MESDSCYFRRRADEELAAASSSDCESARESHLELARRYAQLAAAIDESIARLGPLPGSL